LRTADEAVALLEGGASLHLGDAWPVRRPRPAGRRLPSDRPFATGQRVFDFLFPVAEGGTVAVPGGFGTGKTVIEQTLAKHAVVDVVIYVGCGERGNEMAEVLNEFPSLIDPRTGLSLMDRTILVVNTSNMPVAAREASVYLGMTYAEYYRDMGYGVALMADSLSRWAEALRELSSRLQEMPGEEGYPTYLGNRMGAFYERAGRVVAAGSPERTGAITFIGAISPPGGDFSEPVTQAALRVVGGLWALDAGLAHQRQFPAVDWEVSYSLYVDALAPWFVEHCGADWPELRGAVLQLLQGDRELRDIAGLVWKRCRIPTGWFSTWRLWCARRCSARVPTIPTTPSPRWRRRGRWLHCPWHSTVPSCGCWRRVPPTKRWTSALPGTRCSPSVTAAPPTWRPAPGTSNG
jgi:V/A-type H+-transporting ATPase subunit A